MANITGKKFGGRVKGVPNRVTSGVKYKLLEPIDGTKKCHLQMLQ